MGVNEHDKMHKEKGLFPRGSPKKDLLEKVGTLKLHKEKCSDRHISSSTSKPFRKYQKPWPGRKPDESEEIVKHMSHVPSYLQQNKRQDNGQEKALTVGVLDWGKLERWAHRQKCAIDGGDRASTSRSSLSSLPFPASTSLSFTRIPAVTQEKRSPSKEPAKKSSSAAKNQIQSTDKERCRDVSKSHGSKTSAAALLTALDKDEDNKYCLRIETSEEKIKVEMQKNSETNSSLPELRSDKGIVTENCWVEDKHYSSDREKKVRHKSYDAQYGRNLEQCSHYHCGIMDENQKKPKHKLVGIEQGSVESGIVGNDSLAARLDQQGGTYEKMSSGEHSDIFLFSEPSYIPQSCPLPCTFPTDESDEVCIKRATGGLNTKSMLKNPVIHVKKDLRFGAKVVEGGKQKSFLSKDSETSNSGTELTNHLLSASKKQLTRSASLKEESSSEHLKTSEFTFLPKLFRYNGNNSTKRQKSPLRRILDPFLKPKDSSVPVSALPKRHSYEPDKFDRSFIHEEIELSFGKRKSSYATADSIHQRNINVTGKLFNNEERSLRDLSNEQSTRQTILRISWKNGLPFFVMSSSDNETLAATATFTNNFVQNDDLECLYTIFSVDKSKKKGIPRSSSGSDSKNPHLFSSFVSHLQVSRPKSNYDSHGHQFLQEFVLFGAELVPTQQNFADSTPNNELAAFIVNVPIELAQNGRACTVTDSKFSQSLLLKPSKTPISCAGQESQQSNQSIYNKKASGFVAILPRDVHGLTTDRKPTPLIKRWQSGEACDCGGWDEGCMLSILCDKLPDRGGYFAQADTNRKFQLFIQGAPNDKNHALSMVSSKEGLYTVEFRPPIAFVQAFAICIANIHIRKLYSSERRESIREHLVSSDNRKPASDVLRRFPKNYISCHPPLSPVRRA